VYPLEVENVLADHPGVAHIAVVPRPDAVMGEIGVAVVVARRGGDPPTLDALRAYGRDRLAAYKLPEAMVVTGELPRTAMEKIDRAALGALVATPTPIPEPETATAPTPTPRGQPGATPPPPR
jgi:acyl-CoA synthetase (AMP-forming)/AMP-acid ligase II